MATVLPFDVAEQTKAATDQIMTVVTQAQKATLAAVKTVTGAMSPMLDAIPTVPFMPSTADMTKVIDVTFESMVSMLDSQKAFAKDLVGAAAPAAKATKTK